MMAGAFTQENATKLADRLGRDATEGELYIAHFLGAAGASRLIALAESRPLTAAADVFPAAARANPTIFYDRQGRARGAGEVYGVLVGRYDTARAGAANSVAGAEATDRAVSAAATPDPAGTVESYASGLPSASSQAEDGGAVFHGLFLTDARREAVAPMISALWTAPTSVSAAETAPAKADSDRGGMRDLFQDQASDVRALFRGRV
jgi:hypothetical protein